MWGFRIWVWVRMVKFKVLLLVVSIKVWVVWIVVLVRVVVEFSCFIIILLGFFFGMGRLEMLIIFVFCCLSRLKI